LDIGKKFNLTLTLSKGEGIKTNNNEILPISYPYGINKEINKGFVGVGYW